MFTSDFKLYVRKMVRKMKVFVAGGSGAVGRRLVKMLVADGYRVTVMTRSPNKGGAIRNLGADAVVADGLDHDAVMRAVANAQPEIVIHQMTDLAGVTNLRKFDDEFAHTNRLRIEGTDNLLNAAMATGVRQFIAQSYGNWNYAPVGIDLKSEDDPFDTEPLENQRKSLEAIRHLENAVTGARGMDGVALRYANFYGPGTSISLDGDIVKLVQKRRLPIIGDGAGVWSFVHIDDAAAATMSAIKHRAAGIFNIVDNEPAPVAVWLPELARILKARPPRHFPVWLGRLLAGDVLVSMMTRMKGTTNAKAKSLLGWRPSYGTWREGFRSCLAEIPDGTHSPYADRTFDVS
jgi:nucleoside-diphosphate-sugar epimerase